MLDYEWVNPSTIILAVNETVAATDSNQTHRQIFDHNHTMLLDPILHSSTTPTNGFLHHHHFKFNPPQPNNNHHPSFDPRASRSASTTSFSSPPPMLSPLAASHCGIEIGLGPRLGLFLMPKFEDAVKLEGSSSGLGHEPGPRPGLGLNLKGRTYFASCNDNITDQLYRTAKSVEPVSAVSSNSRRCQVKSCNADLSEAKHYHRRHKVCEYHSKAATVVAAGLTQRFYQQCSRFHLLSEFDNGKRSCRKRLADHNRRRRKTQQAAQDIHKSQPSLDNVAMNFRRVKLKLNATFCVFPEIVPFGYGKKLGQLSTSVQATSLEYLLFGTLT